MVTDCILHIPVCFEKRDDEVEMLEKNLKRLRGEVQNSINPFDLEIYVSINGIEKQRKVLDQLASRYDVHLFNRKNVGYQWGGFYDVWKMTQDKPADWYATLEVDCYFLSLWFDKLVNKASRGYVGPAPLKHSHIEVYPVDWKGAKGKSHTNGAFEFCSKELLEKIDKKFGCFTDATGCDLRIDGILHGEVGFCQKVMRIIPLIAVEDAVRTMQVTPI